MSWIYNQSNGSLSHNGVLVGVGYSGFETGENNPTLQNEQNIGPIPQGEWTIVGVPFDSPDHGPYCLRLEPQPGTDTFGRGGFLIHGDSIIHPGLASKGCIIMLHAVRISIWESNDKELSVT